MVGDVSVSNLGRLPRPAHAQNLPGHVHAVLLEAILTNVLAPGERLLLDEIAEHFGVSKIPVREAIKALEVSGWLETQPRRGTYVRALSLDELHQIFEMRRVLEPYAARKAAERRTAAHLEQLRELVASSDKAVARGDVDAIIRINSDFYSVILEAVGNKIISSACGDLVLRLRRYFAGIDAHERHNLFLEHEKIYEAIRDQDAYRAEQFMILHLEKTESLAARLVTGPLQVSSKEA
jgi:DNA-binding GntR family transcriptional regulator